MPESDGGGGGDAEGVDPVRHRDANHVIGRGDLCCGEPVTFVPEHDRKPWLRR